MTADIPDGYATVLALISDQFIVNVHHGDPNKLLGLLAQALDLDAPDGLHRYLAWSVTLAAQVNPQTPLKDRIDWIRPIEAGPDGEEEDLDEAAHHLRPRMYDEIVVERLIAGATHPGMANDADRAEAVRRMQTAGMALNMVASRLGVNHETIRRHWHADAGVAG